MSTTTTAQAVRSLCTPDQHSQTSKTKPVILLALGTGPHGKTATLEFPEGWQRTIDLMSQFDGWHPLFSDLPCEDRQRLREHTQAALVKHPDGTLSRPNPLSFMRRVETARGKFVKFTYFDVAAQDCLDGAATGYRCAAELLEALAIGHGPHISLRHLMTEVVEAEKEASSGVNRRAAAATFVEVTQEALIFFAKHASHRSYINSKISNAEAYKQRIVNQHAIARTEFVERMKVAKTAKREALAAMAHVSQVMEAGPA